MARTNNADGQRTRQAILDAALDLFADKGFFGTSLRDVAKAVGVRESGSVAGSTLSVVSGADGSLLAVVTMARRYDRGGMPLADEKTGFTRRFKDALRKAGYR